MGIYLPLDTDLTHPSPGADQLVTSPSLLPGHQAFDGADLTQWILHKVLTWVCHFFGRHPIKKPHADRLVFYDAVVPLSCRHLGGDFDHLGEMVVVLVFALTVPLAVTIELVLGAGGPVTVLVIHRALPRAALLQYRQSGTGGGVRVRPGAGGPAAAGLVRGLRRHLHLVSADHLIPADYSRDLGRSVAH